MELPEIQIGFFAPPVTGWYVTSLTPHGLTKSQSLEIIRRCNDYDGLVSALKANARKCSYFDGKKFCGEIGRHMWDDYDSHTEYRCNKHRNKRLLNHCYSGIFKPSDMAKQVLREKQ